MNACLKLNKINILYLFIYMYIILIIHNSSKEYILIVDILCKYNVG